MNINFTIKVFILSFFTAVTVFGQQKNQNWFPQNINSSWQNWDSTWLQANNGQNNKKQLVKMRFSKVLSANDSVLLHQHSFEIIEYLGAQTYVLSINAKSRFFNQPTCQGVALLGSNYKVSSILQAQIAHTKELDVLVKFYNKKQTSEVQQILQAYAAQLLPSHWTKVGLFTVRIKSRQLMKLASNEAVQYISPISENVDLDKDSKGAEAAVGASMPLLYGGKNLKGKGLKIGIGDAVSGIYHIDQKDRVINYNNGPLANHGIFVNSIIGGEGIMNWAAQGIASESQFLCAFYDAILSLKKDFYAKYQMNLTNNSYAAMVGNCTYSGTYDNLSQYLDSIAFETPNQLDVFAAGNDGTLTCGGYPSGYYNVCGGFQTAKNILTVGSTDREKWIAFSSSRGPIKDGRLKPEICAPGHNVLGGILNNAYVYSSGTSFACPQVTGVLALLTERYQQLHSGLLPASDLLKALAVNGAVDLGNPGPDYWYGFGMLNAERSLRILENSQYFTNSISSGAATQTYTISVPANTAALKVMLYYHDPKASAASLVQLVNDIDLSVETPLAAATHLPLILDPSPANVSKNAVEGYDRLNNIEQVVIPNPDSGTYTIKVDGFAIPSGPQKYCIVYDIVPKKIQWQFPLAHSAVPANTDAYFFWDAPSDSLTSASLELSIDSGFTWVPLSTSISPNQNHLKFSLGLINSGKCFLKVKKGALDALTGPFAIHEKPTLTLHPNQCPGTILISWSAVPAASKYYILLKKGSHFAKIDSVLSATTAYTIKGLNPNETYYVSVQPVIDNIEGYRANAVSCQPNSGACASMSVGDLSINKILSPSSGRSATSTELKTKSPLQIELSNRSAVFVSQYDISYQLNALPWQVLHFTSGLYAGATIQPIIDSIDCSDTIDYVLKIAISNKDALDPISVNDTLIKVFKHIPNKALVLTTALLNHFDSTQDITLHSDTIGFTKDNYWDYYTNKPDTGRLRTRIPGSILVTSKGSISLDVNVNDKSTLNYLTGTFNLSNYDTSIDEVRFDFDYEMRGMPTLRDSNKVWIRGSDLQPWISVMKYSNVYDPTKLHQSGTLSLRQILKANHQNFSTSTQIRFGQFDTTLIVDDYYGGGLTLDNIKLYKVIRDVQLQAIVAPQQSECNITGSAVTLRIKNGTTQIEPKVKVSYAIDGKSPLSVYLPDTLKPNEWIDFTFPIGLDSLSLGAHHLQAWLESDGDDYRNNDSIMNFTFYNSQYIDSFPYLQNFETNAGTWYAKGYLLSWEYGVAKGASIAQAASGTKLWKTGLSQNHYNSNEKSYLVSPCFNTIAMSVPMLSFSLAFDIEDCKAPCDRLYLQYSADNESTWETLGVYGEGTNWYNNEAYPVWNGTATQWHVASITLPRAMNLKLRFVFEADMGTTFEGAAIDDIHIFDLKYKIASAPSNTVLEPISGDNFTNSIKGTTILNGINPKGQNLGKLSTYLYQQHSVLDPEQAQYIMPRSYLLQASEKIDSPMLVRLFLKDSEAQHIWKDTSCKNCTKAIDAYRLGITLYSDPSLKREDSLLQNDLQAGKTFIPYTAIQWVPYDEGYYADFYTKQLGEFWFNDGGFLKNIPANTNLLHLEGFRLAETKASLMWQCAIDSQINIFKLCRSVDQFNFDTINEYNASSTYGHDYIVIDHIKGPALNADTLYYKVIAKAINGDLLSSNTIALAWTGTPNIQEVYPIPSTDAWVHVKWTAGDGSDLNYQIFNTSGKLVEHGKFTASQWDNLSHLDLNYLSKGVYFLKLQLLGQEVLKKIILK